MRVTLSELKPNPFRNFAVDPLDKEVVAKLKESISKNPAGFWGGIVARKHNGSIELAFGHHRIEAAKSAGIHAEDIKVVPDISDAEMIRMYAGENATQRGNQGTAITGTVASATRYLLKGIFVGDVSLNGETSQKSHETLQGQAVTGKGIGEPVITDFLKNIPGINKKVVEQQLKNLKSSGHYDKIVIEIKNEIEEELREIDRKEEKRIAELAKAATAAEQAASFKRDRIFDLEGVSRHIKVPSHLDVFREIATGPGLKTVRGDGTELLLLPVDRQADLAKRLVEYAAEHFEELSGRFIKENLVSMALDAKGTQRRLSAKERAELLRKDWSAQAKAHQEQFARQARGMLAAALALSDHAKKRPHGVTLHMTGEFRDAVDKADKAIDLLRKAKIV